MPKITSLDYKKLLSKKDFEFLYYHLGFLFKDEISFSRALKNTSTRHKLFASKNIFKAIQSKHTHTYLSPYLYYAIQVSYTLEQSGLREPKLADSLSINLAKVSEGLKKSLAESSVLLKNPSSVKTDHIPLMMVVGIKDPKGKQKQFQIVADLKRACILLEGVFAEKWTCQVC